jgi:hypothetical protein
MSIEEPMVSTLMNGSLASFSSEQLMRLLTALGRDIEITVKDMPRSRTRGLIRVRSSGPPHRALHPEPLNPRAHVSLPARSVRAIETLRSRPSGG